MSRLQTRTGEWGGFPRTCCERPCSPTLCLEDSARWLTWRHHPTDSAILSPDGNYSRQNQDIQRFKICSGAINQIELVVIQNPFFSAEIQLLSFHMKWNNTATINHERTVYSHLSRTPTADFVDVLFSWLKSYTWIWSEKVCKTLENT